MALLVDLDRIDAAIVALIVVFADGLAKGVVNLADAVAQDVGEADEDRQLDAACLELVDEFFEIDGLVGAFVGLNGDVAGFIDAEVSLAPQANVVGVDRVLDLPLFH